MQFDIVYDSFNVRTEVKKLIDNPDIGEESIHELHFLLLRKKVCATIEELLHLRGFPKSDTLIDNLFNILLKANGTSFHKLSFLNELTTTGIIDINKLLVPANLLNIDDCITTKYPWVYDSIKHTLVKYSGSIPGVGQQLGCGELLLILLASDVYLAPKNGEKNGDLNIGPSNVEVKSTYGRLNAPHGFGSSVSAEKFLYSKLEEISKTSIKDLTKIYGSWNWKKKNMALSSFFRDYLTQQKAKIFMKDLLLELYENMTEAQLEPILDTITTDGSFDTSEFVRRYVIAIFEYYQTLINWDGLLWIDGSNLNTLYITNSEQFSENLNKTLKIDSPGPIWGCQQDNAPKVYLK